ncbi:hypothetical protein L288_17150 [Sphingobium quisquiliarum P25]|uniref:FAD dependent oxidoreductase domain-containing protein n=1 Tax=Sphingobium quisquiliarum P25 TaxID=1329909 RepID=T0GPN2_9SPHN|nr:FAD-dependent oxidoreductase [Sphingobium quisquiliarum]EQB01948.1 hypothetical protein L288_17150 [Sphingobium quisquiliarum P25]
MIEHRANSANGSRRSFLKGLGVAAAASATKVAAAPAISRNSAHVVVIGAGAFGAWTALTLLEQGYKVTLVDAYGPGNPRATSSGETRQIRHAYGASDHFTRSTIRAIKLWRAREQEWGQKLLYPGIRFAMQKAWTPRIEAQKALFDKYGLKYEIIDAQEIAHRYPQINPEGLVGAFVENEASAMIAAHAAILRIADEFQKKGGKIVLGRAMPGTASGRKMDMVTLDGGKETLTADSFVFACGPWLPKMFPQLLASKIKVTRCDVVYFGSPAGDKRFMWPNFPQLNGEFSTYPSFPFGGGVKVIPVGGGDMDVDDAERIVAPDQVRRAREYIAKRVPALADMPITKDEVCQFDTAAGGEFIIDAHPDYDNVWIAGGSSAHGFKHGPVIGEYLAARVTSGEADPGFTKAFALASHTDVTAGYGMSGG